MSTVREMKAIKDVFLKWLGDDVAALYMMYAEPESVDTATRLLSGAFLWHETPEGCQFWSVLNKKWRCICEEAGL